MRAVEETFCESFFANAWILEGELDRLEGEQERMTG
jgi:hypothetical protein